MSNTIGTTPGAGRALRTGQLGAGGEAAQYIAATTGQYQVLGYETISVTNTAGGVTLGISLAGAVPPAGATHALLSLKPTATGTDLIRVRQDNVAPTNAGTAGSGGGLPLFGGEVMEVCPITVSAGVDTPALGRVKVIAGQAAAMELTVEYRSYAAA